MPRSEIDKSYPRIDAVLIGSSTGGPKALEHLLKQFEKPLPVPIFVVQHLPAGFSSSLASRLNRVCRFEVVIAQHGMPVRPGRCYLAPGNRHLSLLPTGTISATVQVEDGPRVRSCRPSLNVLMESATAAYHQHLLSVILTGMGDDGLHGARLLSELGAPIIVQDRATSAVWGMPGAIAKAGLADACLPLDEIAGQVERWVKGTDRRRVRKMSTV